LSGEAAKQSQAAMKKYDVPVYGRSPIDRRTGRKKLLGKTQSM